MTSQAHELAISISGVFCGTLSEDAHGALTFTYSPAYRGVPLSLSMPVGLQTYGNRIVRPYLMGLLPDDESTRNAIGAPYGISGDNPFRLLSVIGSDCPGAIQIHSTETGTSPNSTQGELLPLNEADIAGKLAAIRENAAAAWTDSDRFEGHWSLGGCQAKIALRMQDDQWFECLGSEATTHILKPGVEGFDHQALVEYLSMRIASSIGLPAAHVDYQLFQNEPAIIVERYDRMRLANNSVVRIHQEDFCQALSVSPARKYAEQGGPTTPCIIALLRQTGRNARDNIYRFILYLFFNYLIGATDAHAKNHSLLFMDNGDIRLAPLYDVASIAPYRSLSPSKRKPLRAALSIGGENRFGMLGAEHVAKMVSDAHLENLDLGAQELIERLRLMASIVPDAVDQEIECARDQGMSGVDDIGQNMSEEIRQNCSRTLEQLR